MEPGHVAIATLLAGLRHAKPDGERIDLFAVRWTVDAPSARTAFAALGQVLPESLAASRVTETGPWDGRLQIGDRMEFHGRMPFAGHVHLFNLGTSGTCAKLAPSPAFPEGAEVHGHAFRIPAAPPGGIEALASEGGFTVTGPGTRETGEPERLLAIVTVDEIDLRLEDLHPRLVGRRPGARSIDSGPGFAGPARAESTGLFRLEAARWEYGLLSMEIIGRGDPA